MKAIQITAVVGLCVMQSIVYAQDQILPLEAETKQVELLNKSDANGEYFFIEDICKKLDAMGEFNTNDRNKNGKASAQLGSFWVYENTLFYKLKVNNQSNIKYDVDFIRFYVGDLKTAKRSVSQEMELQPSYSYGNQDQTIDGQSSEQYVFALDKFPITKDKALFIEVYERNGGRHLYLKAKQADIEKAKAIR